MRERIIRTVCRALPLCLLCGIVAACDAHIEGPDTTIRPGHILCVDGSILPYSDFAASGKEAIAVVFHTNPTGETAGDGYAVYLWDVSPKEFADSLGVEQGTSADLTAYDGNQNTSSLYDTQEVASPLAESVFALWKYGQSSYVPSVAEMRLLYQAKAAVNPTIELCGGDVLPEAADECWYWTSTEVSEQETVKAWLYSLSSGVIQETPKNQAHKVRPIITLNLQP